MAHFNEDFRGDYRGDDRRRFGGISRWGEDRREDEWRGEGRSFDRDRGREDFGSRTYVAGGRGDERSFGEGYGRGYREDYGSGRYGGGFGADYDRGRFGRDFGEGYDRDRFARDDTGRFGFGREDFGRGESGRFGMGREDFGRGSYGTSGYGQSGYGMGSYGQGSYGQSGYGMGEGRGYGLGLSDYRGMGRGYGDEDFRERGELRRGAGEHEGRGAMDRLREGARRLMGKGPKSYRRSDERIRDDINDRLLTSWMDAEEVEVVVKDGEVTLTGSVYTRDEKRGIEDLAEDVLGVKEVHNHLRANRGGSGLNPQPGSATREMGTSSTTGSTAGRGAMHS